MRILLRRDGKWIFAEHTELPSGGMTVEQIDLHDVTTFLLLYNSDLYIFSKSRSKVVVDVDLANPISARVLTDDMTLPEQRRMALSGIIGGPSNIGLMDTVQLSRELMHGIVAVLRYSYNCRTIVYGVTFFISIVEDEAFRQNAYYACRIISQLDNMCMYYFDIASGHFERLVDSIHLVLGRDRAKMFAGCRYYAIYDDSMLSLLDTVCDEETTMAIMSNDEGYTPTIEL